MVTTSIDVAGGDGVDERRRVLLLSVFAHSVKLVSPLLRREAVPEVNGRDPWRCGVTATGLTQQCPWEGPALQRSPARRPQKKTVVTNVPDIPPAPEGQHRFALADGRAFEIEVVRS